MKPSSSDRLHHTAKGCKQRAVSDAAACDVRRKVSPENMAKINLAPQTLPGRVELCDSPHAGQNKSHQLVKLFIDTVLLILVKYIDINFRSSLARFVTPKEVAAPDEGWTGFWADLTRFARPQ